MDVTSTNETIDRLNTMTERLRLRNKAIKKNAFIRRPSPKVGIITVTTRDSISKCRRVKNALMSKMKEVARSNMESGPRSMVQMDIQNQMMRIDQKIGQIRKRTKEEELEKTKKSSKKTGQKKTSKPVLSTEVRRQYLYSARDGGFNPRSLTPRTNCKHYSKWGTIETDRNGNVKSEKDKKQEEILAEKLEGSEESTVSYTVDDNTLTTISDTAIADISL